MNILKVLKDISDKQIKQNTKSYKPFVKVKLEDKPLPVKKLKNLSY